MQSKSVNDMVSRKREAVARMRAGDYAQAIRLLSAVIEGHNCDTDWRLLVNRSYCYQRSDRLDAALEDANRAVRVSDASFGALYRLGCVQLALKQYRSAENTMNEALERQASDKFTIDVLRDIRSKYCRELGFGCDESSQMAEAFDSVSAISDAVIGGKFVQNGDINGAKHSAGIRAPKRNPFAAVVKSVAMPVEAKAQHSSAMPHVCRPNVSTKKDGLNATENMRFVANV